jgi:hypothetical protein
MLGNVSFETLLRGNFLILIIQPSCSPCYAEYAAFTPISSALTSTKNIRIDYAIANKLTPFISMQNHYSLIYREEEREMMPTLKVRV